MPQIEHIYSGAFRNLSKYIQDKKCIIFYSRSVYTLCPDVKCFIDLWNQDKYTGITSNPTYDDINKAIEQFQKKYEVVVALGGGSVIDFAKAFLFSTNLQMELIAIPTTAGTGSEATQFATIYKGFIKTSIDNAIIYPRVSIVDFRLYKNVPKDIRISTSLDAFSHAIESFWAVKGTNYSRKLALIAIKICKKYIKTYIAENNEKSIKAMAIASHIAGKAINISRTTAAHALSYTMTARYGIPHGKAVALSIPYVFMSNFKQNNDKFLNVNSTTYENIKKTIFSVFEITKPEEFLAYWEELMVFCQISTNLNDYGINKDIVISTVNLDRLSNNLTNISHDINSYWI